MLTKARKKYWKARWTATFAAGLERKLTPWEAKPTNRAAIHITMVGLGLLSAVCLAWCAIKVFRIS